MLYLKSDSKIFKHYLTFLVDNSQDRLRNFWQIFGFFIMKTQFFTIFLLISMQITITSFFWLEIDQNKVRQRIFHKRLNKKGEKLYRLLNFLNRTVNTQFMAIFMKIFWKCRKQSQVQMQNQKSDWETLKTWFVSQISLKLAWKSGFLAFWAKIIKKIFLHQFPGAITLFRVVRFSISL